MSAPPWYLAVALGALATASGAQEYGGGGQAFEMPSMSFGDDSDLGKYNYLGKLPDPGIYQIPGQGSPVTIDDETLKKLYTCVDVACKGGLKGSLGGKYVWAPANKPLIPGAIEVAVPVASDEVRLENPQSVELGLRLTVAGISSVVTIKPADSVTQKLVPGQTAIAEISSGSTVTTTQLNPGSAYAIQVLNGAYFIVPAN